MKSFKQYISEDITESSNFRKWFGNSLVLDWEGNPMVMYHGSPTKGINIFSHDHHKNANDDTLGKGFYFSASSSFAERYMHSYRTGKFGGEVYAAYLCIDNPYLMGYPEHEDIVDELFGRFPELLSAEEKTQKLIDAGFDGIICQDNGVDVIEGYGVAENAELVVFKPTQIKSATDNNGDFNPNNPDITK